MPGSRSILAATVAIFVSLSPAFAFQSPLSDTAARSAYFLGQRRDMSMAQFLARYTKHLQPPRTGPYISDVTLFTPYAQLVYYSSRQAIYSAQQAELDRAKFSSVEITVEISFTQTYGLYISEPPPSNSSGGGTRLRHADFWRDFDIHVSDGKNDLEPDSQFAEPLYLCSDDGCTLTGSLIHLSFSSDVFSSGAATVDVTTPDDQAISVEFDLDSLL